MERAQASVSGSTGLEIWLFCLPGVRSWASHTMALTLSLSSKIPPKVLVEIEWLVQVSGTILIRFACSINSVLSPGFSPPIPARKSYSPPPASLLPSEVKRAGQS